MDSDDADNETKTAGGSTLLFVFERGFNFLPFLSSFDVWFCFIQPALIMSLICCGPDTFASAGTALVIVLLLVTCVGQAHLELILTLWQGVTALLNSSRLRI